MSNIKRTLFSRIAFSQPPQPSPPPAPATWRGLPPPRVPCDSPHNRFRGAECACAAGNLNGIFKSQLSGSRTSLSRPIYLASLHASQDSVKGPVSVA